MRIEEIKSQAEKKHNKGESLYDGGYSRIENTKEGDGFVVYDVVYKNCNKGGVRNSGITMWEGIFASDGMKEIEVKPLSLWRNGENANNDRPWLRFGVIEIKGKQLVLRNYHDGRIEVHDMDFNEAKAFLVKEMTGYEWALETAKTKSDFYGLVCRSAYDVLRNSNPRGSNSIDTFVIRGGESRGAGKTENWPKDKYVPISEIENDETIVLIGTECLYGDPVRYRVFTGKLQEKRAKEIMVFPETRRTVTRIKIFPKEREVKHQRYEGHDSKENKSIYSTMRKVGF
ncbi:MAG: hypothetical protein KJ905_03895 [Nanoarchaeota archaeon]|nr:hypothetical protein [Nanoarchaeota archaeon]MBU1501883.1 hypothetical protein [Nanoarchaeota archaeon]MBU2458982.1 hypothetical protein [Nanoarchaeota archaeon]